MSRSSMAAAWTTDWWQQRETRSLPRRPTASANMIWMAVVDPVVMKRVMPAPKAAAARTIASRAGPSGRFRSSVSGNSVASMADKLAFSHSGSKKPPSCPGICQDVRRLSANRSNAVASGVSAFARPVQLASVGSAFISDRSGQ